MASRWNERQRGLLDAMGLPLWDAAETTAQTPAPTARPPVRAAPVVPQAPMAPPAPPPAAPAPAPHPDVPATVARMDWDALEATVAGCVACPLAAGRTRTVFGTGHRRAHWMLVGEAPGENEDRLGEPFVGASGRLLDAMLHAVGLTRDAAPPERQVYIANTVKCRPPGNRNPQPVELARCEAYLTRQIALVQPRVIVALGRFAAQSLAQSDAPIGKLRGRVHRYEDVPLVATYHPAYLLRNLEEKARAWDDLCLAREVVATTAARDA